MERCASKTLAVMNGTLQVMHRPYGPVAVLGPYNFPAHLPHGQIIPALLAGNSVVFKPSEYTPGIAEALVQLWEQAGLPEGVLNLVLGAKDVGSWLIEAQDIKGVFFTGSATTGRAIEAHALQFPHRICALEMGGNNPLIYSGCADTDAAVYITIQSAFVTSGQRCSCARRLIVVESESSQLFCDRLVETASKLSLGHFTARPEPYMGPVISEQAAKKILQAYQSAAARPLLPMHSRADNAAYLSPGIVDVTGIEVPDNEVFGPLLYVKRVKNFQDAIQEANRTRYGLAAGIISDDKLEQQVALHELEAGIINCNFPLTGASGQAPFGGIKESGNCRPAGYYACDFTAFPVASQLNSLAALPESLPAGYPKK
jgi:succinylglutamic semialdehyde dehydrogenase